MKYQNGGGEPFEKIKEREKKKKRVGARQPWRLSHPKWQAFSFFLLGEDESG